MSSISTTTSTQRQRVPLPKLTGLVAALLLFTLAAGALWITTRPAALPGQPATEAAIAERWGIRIQHIAVLADGGLIDFRFQVLDPDKAAPLFDLPTRPLLYVEQTGKQIDSLYHPPHGHNFTAGQSQYFIYNNAYGVIQPGVAVSVVLGDLRLEHIIAQ